MYPVAILNVSKFVPVKFLLVGLYADHCSRRLTDVTPTDALNECFLTSVDWHKCQSGDRIISRIKELAQCGQKSTRRAVEREQPD